MNVLNTVKIIPVTELRRNFGSITAGLERYREIILTKDGRPFATLRPARETRRELLHSARGAWKGTALDVEGGLWSEARKKKSRDRKITL